jgi:hypothetical protein
MYSCPRTTRENVTLVHLWSRISVTISTAELVRLLNYNSFGLITDFLKYVKVFLAHNYVD